MRGRNKKLKKIFISSIMMISILVIVIVLYLQLSSKVVDEVTIEAGTAMPDITEFLRDKKSNGILITDLKEIKDIGSYGVEVKVGRKIYTSILNIVDTVAPTAKAVNRMAMKDEELEAKEFVTDIEDATEVSVTYIEKPDVTKLGEQKVKIRLEDKGKNHTELQATVTVLDIKSSVTVEAGSAMEITIHDFVNSNQYDVTLVTDISSLDTSKVVAHEVILLVDGREVAVTIDVVDTTAPEAVFVDNVVWKDDMPDAMTFVSSVVDVSQVTATYKEQPNFSQLGQQEVTIQLADEYGNTAEGSVLATVKEDTEAPVIVGARDKTVYIGNAISYKKDVYVTDNKDENLTFEVDSSGVNLKTEGVYSVFYTAKDTAGNEARVEKKITVVDLTISEEMVNEEADAVLVKILEDGMTQEEMAKAIYKWIKGNVGYTGDSDKTDWLGEAHRAMTDYKGDCFTYYAVSQALLTRAGIENMLVTRVGGKTKHFWNLINCGSGWYHFDSCPNKDGGDSFMLTDKEVEELTDKRGNNYYVFDKTLYPATPEE